MLIWIEGLPQHAQDRASSLLLLFNSTVDPRPSTASSDQNGGQISWLAMNSVKLHQYWIDLSIQTRPRRLRCAAHAFIEGRLQRWRRRSSDASRVVVHTPPRSEIHVRHVPVAPLDPLDPHSIPSIAFMLSTGRAFYPRAPSIFKPLRTPVEIASRGVIPTRVISPSSCVCPPSNKERGKMARPWCFYYVQGEEGESPEEPNAFQVRTRLRIPWSMHIVTPDPPPRICM